MSLQIFLLTVLAIKTFSSPTLYPLSIAPGEKLNTSSISDSWKTSNLTSILTRGQYRCDGPRFGYNLYPGSCLQAWGFIPLTVGTQLYFGERGDGGIYDVGLPKRYLSLLDLREGMDEESSPLFPLMTQWDFVPQFQLPARASPKQAAAAALSVIRNCANGIPSVGGCAINFGGDDDLAVTVAAFVPSVTCEGRVGGPGIYRSCEGIIDRMNASKARITFGPAARSGAEVWLPYVDRADDRCVMAISTSYDQVDRSSWYRLWEAATAINAMCVRHGKAGYWRNRDVISERGQLSISLGDESVAEDVWSPSAVE
ncbi:NADPH:adrenodoxin oxidoreductase [Physcia stellaris]|nr:NADPH:adrenodoxin oxidoreductase [Physcia stellaris]